MEPMTDKNKSLVELLLNIGKFDNCLIKTKIESDKIILNIKEKSSGFDQTFVLNVEKTLVNSHHFLAGDIAVYVLVFDKVPQDKPFDITSETFIATFYISMDGEKVGAIQLNSYKNTIYRYPGMSFVFKRNAIEAGSSFNCNGK